MICRYATTIICACPLDDGRDTYQAEFESPSIIKVEDIIAAISVLVEAKAFQEDITESLARNLGCKVTTIGMHSGVLTTVVAP